MKTIQGIFNFFKFKIETRPVPFGIYHLICLVLIILVCIFVCKKYNNVSLKKVEKLILIMWAIAFVAEIYKQLVYSISIIDGEFVWDYQWYSFPFQFCSTPLYIMPLAIIIKNKKIKDALYSFLAFFSLFGGAIVLAYPEQVFSTSIVGVLLQTMVHHGIMVITSILLIVHYKDRLNIKFYLSGLVVFIITLIIAQVLNETFIYITDEVFNMFYISRHFPSTLVFVKDIYYLIPYPLIPTLYFIGFSLIAFAFYLISKGLAKKEYDT